MINYSLILFIKSIFLISSLFAADMENEFYLSDSLYNEGLYGKSFLKIKKIYNQNSDNVDVVFRMARSIFIKAQEENNKKKQIKYYYQGFEYAKKAIKIDSQNGYVNFWYAAYLGRIGEIEGRRQAILNSYEVKKYALKAIELAPDYNHPYHMMGRWHYELADLSQFNRVIASIVYETLPEASYNEAVIFFKNAIKIKPNEIRDHFWLAKTYYAIGDYDLSKKEFKAALSFKAKDEEEEIMQSESKKHL